jgi:hypothetical protein
MKQQRPLTTDEEKEILRWCYENPEADLEPKIAEWRAKFECSRFSIYQVFVKEAIGQIEV